MADKDVRVDLELTYIKNPDGSRAPSLPDGLRQAAIEFVQSNARQPATHIAEVIETGHNRMMAALDGMSETQAAFKPAPDEWSVLELMAHVVSTKQVMGVLTAAMAKGELPPGFGAATETQASQDGFIVSKFETLAAAQAAAQEAQASMLSFARGLDGELNTELTFRHYIFGPLNCREWVVFQRIHDDNHAPQVDQIKASPGFPKA
jgi:hypothetical protein